MPTAEAAVKQHWAVEAVGEGRLRAAESEAAERLRSPPGNRPDISPELGSAHVAYWICVYEGLAHLRGAKAEALPGVLERTVEAASLFFDAHGSYPIPDERHDYQLACHVLHLAVAASVGGRQGEMGAEWEAMAERRISAEHGSEAATDEEMAVLWGLVLDWVRLLCWRPGDGLAPIRQIVHGADERRAALRAALEGTPADRLGWRLVALLHWGKATDSTAQCILAEGQADEAAVESLDNVCDSMVKAAGRSDARFVLEPTMGLLQGAAIWLLRAGRNSQAEPGS